MNRLIRTGLPVFGVFMIVNNTVYRFADMPAIVILVTACVPIIATYCTEIRQTEKIQKQEV